MASSSTPKKRSPVKQHVKALDFVKGIVAAYLVTIPVFLIFSVILANTDFPEKHIQSVVIATTIISVLVAGSVVTHGLKNKGWINGGFAGLIYMLVLYLFSSIIFRDFSVNRYIITVFIIGILAGCIGGILGINLKRSNKIKSR